MSLKIGIQHHFQYVKLSFNLAENRNIGIFSVPNKKNHYLNDTPFFMAQIMKFHQTPRNKERTTEQ